MLAACNVGGCADRVEWPFLNSRTPVNNYTVFVDNTLGADIANGAYSIANRNASGSDGNAYTTLAAAIAAIDDTDVIFIRAGTYAELSTNNTCYRITRPCTIQPYDNEAVTLTYDSENPPTIAEGTQGPIIYILSGNVILQDVTVAGTKAIKTVRGDDTEVNVRIADGCDNVIVRGCIIHDAGHAGIKFGAVNGCLIERNQIYDCGVYYWDHGIYHFGYGADDEAGRNTVRFNAIWGSRGRGIQCYSRPDYIDIYGNVLFANGLSGLLVDGANIRVYNNTIYGNGSEQDLTTHGGFIVFHELTTNLTVRNNVFLENTIDINLDTPDLMETGDAGGNVYETGSVIGGAAFADNWPDDETDTHVEDGYNPGFAQASPDTWDDFAITSVSNIAGLGGTVLVAQLLDPGETLKLVARTTAHTPAGAFDYDDP